MRGWLTLVAYLFLAMIDRSRNTIEPEAAMIELITTNSDKISG